MPASPAPLAALLPPSDDAEHPTLHIFFGTKMGSAQAVAAHLEEHMKKLPIEVQMLALNQDYDLDLVTNMVVVCSTTGDGDLPLMARRFDRILRLRAKQDRTLSHVQFVFLALGDSCYPRFCHGGRRLHKRLLGLGAVELSGLTLVDDSSNPSLVIRTWLRDTTRLYEAKVKAGWPTNFVSPAKARVGERQPPPCQKYDRSCSTAHLSRSPLEIGKGGKGQYKSLAKMPTPKPKPTSRPIPKPKPAAAAPDPEGPIPVSDIRKVLDSSRAPSKDTGPSKDLSKSRLIPGRWVTARVSPSVGLPDTMAADELYTRLLLDPDNVPTAAIPGHALDMLSKRSMPMGVPPPNGTKLETLRPFKIINAQYLSPPRNRGSRNIRVEIEIPDAYPKLRSSRLYGLPYLPGDIMCLVPSNPPLLVTRMLQALGIPEMVWDTPIQPRYRAPKRTQRSAAREPPASWPRWLLDMLPSCGWLTYRYLFTYVLDLGTPRDWDISTVLTLMHKATRDPEERDNIKHMQNGLEDDSIPEFSQIVPGSPYTMVKYGYDMPLVLTTYCRSGAQRFNAFDVGMFLPRLCCRQYSIASSPLVDGRCCHIIVKVLDDLHRHSGRPFMGLCSSWLERICMPWLTWNQGNGPKPTESAYFVGALRESPSKFHLPRSPLNRPLIFIATGTGVSPIIGFMRHLAALRAGIKPARNPDHPPSLGELAHLGMTPFMPADTDAGSPVCTPQLLPSVPHLVAPGIARALRISLRAPARSTAPSGASSEGLIEPEATPVAGSDASCRTAGTSSQSYMPSQAYIREQLNLVREQALGRSFALELPSELDEEHDLQSSLGKLPLSLGSSMLSSKFRLGKVTAHTGTQLAETGMAERLKQDNLPHLWMVLGMRHPIYDFVVARSLQSWCGLTPIHRSAGVSDVAEWMSPDSPNVYGALGSPDQVASRIQVTFSRGVPGSCHKIPELLRRVISTQVEPADAYEPLSEEGTSALGGLLTYRDNSRLQSFLIQHGRDLIRLMVDHEAIIYVCGSQSGIGTSCTETLAQLLMEHLEDVRTVTLAHKIINTWVRDQRLRRDLWDD